MNSVFKYDYKLSIYGNSKKKTKLIGAEAIWEQT